MSKVICEECGYADYIHDGGVTCKVESAIRESERERIIKLLDTDFWHHRIWGNPKPTCVQDCPTCDLIALIKGENK